MAVRNRGNEICSFFIYDHRVLKKEEDDLKDAIIYFYPHTVSVDNQCALVGKLIGISDFFYNTLPKSPPKIIKLISEKFASKREGEFTIGLGCDLNIPDDFITRHLDFVWRVFVFFQGSLEALRQRCKGDQTLPTELAKIWDLYLPVCQIYGDLLSQAFQILPDIQLPKCYSKTFLHASHILQRSHRQAGVLGGAILYKSKVLCTQLSPSITKRFLLLKPQQSHLPCQEIKTEFELPASMRLIKVYITNKEYKELDHRRRISLVLDDSFCDESKISFYDTDTNVSSQMHSIPCRIAHSSPIRKRNLTGDEDVFTESESLEDDTKSKLVQQTVMADIHEERETTLKTVDSRETTLLTSAVRETTQDIEANQASNDPHPVSESDSPKLSPSRKEQTAITKANGIRKSFCEVEKESQEQEIVVLEDHEHQHTSVEADTLETLKSKDESVQPDKDNSLMESPSHSRVDQLSSVDSVDKVKSSENISNDCSNISVDSNLESEPCHGDVLDGGTIPDSQVQTVTNVSQEVSNLTIDDERSPEKKDCKLTFVASGGDNSSGSYSASTSGPIGTSEEFSADEETAKTAMVLSDQKSGSDDVEDSDTLSPLNRSHDDKHLVLSGTTVSSLSDDLTSPNKESLEFPEEAEDTVDSLNLSWNVKTPSMEVKDGQFRSSNVGSAGWASNPPQLKERALFSNSESYVSSSYSQSESEASGSWEPDQDELVDLTLYAQGHSEMLLLLLLDNGVKCDKALVTELWRCSLAHLAELDFEVKESVDATNSEKTALSNYYYLSYDSFTRNISGNVIESVAGTAHEFVSTSAIMHDSFSQSEDMTDMLLRSHTASVYGHQSLCRETYFQLTGQQRQGVGFPQPKDIFFTLDQVAAQKLQSDHDLSML